MKTFEIDYIIQHPEEFHVKVEHQIHESISRYTARNLETGVEGYFWVPIEDTIYRPRLEAIVAGDIKVKIARIPLAEVMHRPDDFKINASINNLTREVNVALVDKRFHERSTLVLEEEDPAAPFVAAMFQLAETAVAESDSGRAEAYQRRINILEQSGSEKSSRIHVLEQRVAELEKQIADEEKENDEYAYVEGWDEF